VPKDEDKARKREELSRQWRERTRAYVAAVNEYIERGINTNWDRMGPSDEPRETRKQLAGRVIDVVRSANKRGEIEELRVKFPPAHGPFVNMLEKYGQGIPAVSVLDDNRIVVRVGNSWIDENNPGGYVAVIDGDRVERLSEDIYWVGRSPNREIFALATPAGVVLYRGWDGPHVVSLKWPSGTTVSHSSHLPEETPYPLIVSNLIPFDSGDRALLITEEGIFVLTEGEAAHLLPTSEYLERHFSDVEQEDPDEPIPCGTPMAHGAISPDGRWIACGYQASEHFIFDAATLERVAKIGNLTEYPHCAVFSSDSQVVALNSCHFYDGQTIGVPSNLFPGLETEQYKLDDRFTLLDDDCRVYAGISTDDEFILGDAYGYLRAIDFQGTERWRHFIGSSISAIDFSRDGKTFIATTYAGFLSIIDLHTGARDPFTIGTADHKERRRWLFWKNEPEPLIW